MIEEVKVVFMIRVGGELPQRWRRQVLLKRLYVPTKCQTSRPRSKLPSRIVCSIVDVQVVLVCLHLLFYSLLLFSCLRFFFSLHICAYILPLFE